MQGSSLTARHKARQYVVILAAAHVAAAAASVFLLSQLGGVVNVHLSKPSLLLIVASVAIIGAGMDAQAIRKRAFSVGLHRQTAKALAHLSTEWWVIPLLWGADTGLIWTTFRVSFCSWLLLLLTVLGGARLGWEVCTDWPLRVHCSLLCTFEGQEWGMRVRFHRLVGCHRSALSSPASCRWWPWRRRCFGPPMASRPSGLWCAVLVPLFLATGCIARGPGSPQPAALCDDGVQLALQVPAGMAALGATSAVGSGDTWFFAPAVNEWTSSVASDGERGYQLKIGIWTTETKPPTITVRQVDGPAFGTASVAPTSTGLPGPLPSLSSLPTPGCWEITARGTTGSATARVRIDRSGPP